MPRIRTIKPEFWADEKLAPLEPIDRLVFLGLISMADDFGRLHDNVKVIDAFIFPECSRTSRESVENLSRMGRVRRGKSSSGKRIIQICNWEKHQRVDKPQRATALPAIEVYLDEELNEIQQNPSENSVRESFANGSRIVPEPLATLSGIRDQGSGTLDQGSGSEGARARTPAVGRMRVMVPDELQDEWALWEEHVLCVTGQKIGAPQAQAQLLELSRRGHAKAIKDLQFSRLKGAKTIRDSDHDYDNPDRGGVRNQRNGKTKPISEIMAEMRAEREATA